MRWLELKVPPPLVALLFALAMLMISRALPLLGLQLPGRDILATVAVLLGALVALAGALAFRRHRTTVNPLDPSATSALVSDGIYRHSRNPMYLGFLLILVGWATHLANVAAFLLLPLFVAYITRFQIRPEERVLLAKFGDEFARYMARVRRWL